MTKDHAERLAIAVLWALAAEEDRFKRFLAISGLEVPGLRQAAADPAFLLGVLDYAMSDEGILLACAKAIDEKPEVISQARQALAGSEPLRRASAGRFGREDIIRRSKTS